MILLNVWYMHVAINYPTTPAGNNGVIFAYQLEPDIAYACVHRTLKIHKKNPDCYTSTKKQDTLSDSVSHCCQCLLLNTTSCNTTYHPVCECLYIHVRVCQHMHVDKPGRSEKAKHERSSETRDQDFGSNTICGGVTQ